MAHTRYSQLNDPSKHVDMDHGSVAKTLDHRRRAALEEIDRAPFSRFHLKVACVAGVGFLTDACVHLLADGTVDSQPEGPPDMISLL